MVSDPSDASALRAQALKLLARREHAPAELRRKLTQRGYAGDLSAQVVRQLEAEDLVSVSRYAEAMVQSKAARGIGPLRIRAELDHAGVAEDALRAALAATQWDWPQVAIAAREKRFGQPPPRDFATKAKQMRFLQRRGFDAEQIAAAFAE